MSLNNQELNSFLSVPGDNQDHSFPSLSPQRSGSPRSILSEQLQQQSYSNSSTSNLGSFRTRSRAGTLPSRFNAPTIPVTNPSYPQNYDPTSLKLENLSLSNTPSVIDAPITASNTPAPKTRLRSGSLLGMSESNSIWKNDPQPAQPLLSSSIPSLTQQSNSVISLQDFTKGRLSPSKLAGIQAQTIEENPNNRVRAYSTNTALVNDSTHSSFYLQGVEEERGFNLPLQQFQQQQQQQPQSHEQLDAYNQYNEIPNRPRAQTYQNGAQSQLHIIYNTPGKNDADEKDKSLNSQQSFLNNDQPLLLDSIDPRLLNWTSTYQDSSLGPTNTLFLSNLPPQAVSPVSLANLLLKFGRILTVRIFTGNDSALVEFEGLEPAMHAKAQLNHQELMPGYPSLVTFAKILPLAQDGSPNNQPTKTEVPTFPTTQTPNIQINYQEEKEPTAITKTISENPLTLDKMKEELFTCIKLFGLDENSGIVKSVVNNALKYHGFDNDFGPLPDPIPIRQYDAPKLRETRKLIDANAISQFEIEELSLSVLDELPELSSDYLGNTVVQKLFEISSTPIKLIMLKEVSPYLAQMGIHKNGTWSAQKMVSVADTPLQKLAVSESLKPYTVPLLNDQFGNYVIQCSLKFGAPWNNFIFEVILAKFWTIAKNRFGARAVRACLESHEATTEQTAIISAAIILHAEHLAIDQNAALLITWFLDTCTLPNRHALLAPRLVPHLAQICTHKLASLTVLKLLNNRYEVDAKNIILNALFGPSNTIVDESSNDNKPPEVLEQILRDNVHGATFVFKVISNPQLDPEVRKYIVSQVRRVLLELNVASFQGYKRLLDEVGLGNRIDSNRHNRSHSNGSSRSKGRQNKSSPQNGNQRRSTQNGGYQRNSNQQQQQQPQQQQQQQLPNGIHHIQPPAQPQFLGIPGDFNDYQNQFYQQNLGQPQTPLHAGNESRLQYDNSGGSIHYPGVFDDRFIMNQYQSPTKPFGPQRGFNHEPTQFGYGAAYY